MYDFIIACCVFVHFTLTLTVGECKTNLDQEQTNRGRKHKITFNTKKIDSSVNICWFLLETKL